MNTFESNISQIRIRFRTALFCWHGVHEERGLITRIHALAEVDGASRDFEHPGIVPVSQERSAGGRQAAERKGEIRGRGGGDGAADSRAGRWRRWRDRCRQGW